MVVSGFATGIGFASVFSGFTTGFAAIVVSGVDGAGIGSGLLGPGTVVSTPFFPHPFSPFSGCGCVTVEFISKGVEGCGKVLKGLSSPFSLNFSGV